jgi:hypothetical protein
MNTLRQFARCVGILVLVGLLCSCNRHDEEMTALKSRVEILVAENTAVNDRLKQVEERLATSDQARAEEHRALRVELSSAIARVDGIDFPGLRAWKKDGALNAQRLILSMAATEESMIAGPGNLTFIKSREILGQLTGSELELGGAEYTSIKLNSTGSPRKVSISSGTVGAFFSMDDEQKSLQLLLGTEYAGVLLKRNAVDTNAISLSLAKDGATGLEMVQAGSSAKMTASSADGAVAAVYSATGDFSSGLIAIKSGSEVFAISKVNSGENYGSKASIGVRPVDGDEDMPYGKFNNFERKSQVNIGDKAISLLRNARPLAYLGLAKRGGRIDIYDEVGDTSRIILALNPETGEPGVIVNSGSKVGLLRPTTDLK